MTSHRDKHGRYVKDRETESWKLLHELLAYEVKPSPPRRSRSWIRRVIEWWRAK